MRSDIETVGDLEQLVSGSTKALKAQLTFVVTVLKPVYDAIKLLQRETAGVLDAMDIFHKCEHSPVYTHACTFNRFKATVQKIQQGDLPYEVTKITRSMPAADAKKAGDGFQMACQVCNSTDSKAL